DPQHSRSFGEAATRRKPNEGTRNRCWLRSGRRPGAGHRAARPTQTPRIARRVRLAPEPRELSSFGAGAPRESGSFGAGDPRESGSFGAGASAVPTGTGLVTRGAAVVRVVKERRAEGPPSREYRVARGGRPAPFGRSRGSLGAARRRGSAG